MAMNAMGAEIELKGLDNSSSQPDSAIIGIMDKIKRVEKPVIDVSECPDIMPTAAAISAVSGKTVVITGGRRLRAKESDRISSVAEGLKALGIHSYEFDDGLEIYGKNSIAGGIVDASNDHRIAMAFASLCCAAKGDIIIKGAHCVGKSYPAFFEDLKTLGGKVS